MLPERAAFSFDERKAEASDVLSGCVDEIVLVPRPPESAVYKKMGDGLQWVNGVRRLLDSVVRGSVDPTYVSISLTEPAEERGKASTELIRTVANDFFGQEKPRSEQHIVVNPPEDAGYAEVGLMVVKQLAEVHERARGPIIALGTDEVIRDVAAVGEVHGSVPHESARDIAAMALRGVHPEAARWSVSSVPFRVAA